MATKLKLPDPAFLVAEGQSSAVALLEALLVIAKTQPVTSVAVVLGTEEDYYSYQFGCGTEELLDAATILDQFAALPKLQVH